jgi:Emfourin
MRIVLERSGGFTGIPHQTRLDLAQLDMADREHVQAMIAAAGFFDLPEITHAISTGADQFHYVLTIQDGKLRHTVQASEPDMPEGLRQLIQEIIRLGR